MTLSTSASSYQGQATISVSGTISPAPATPKSSVIITTKGQTGFADIGKAIDATGSGAFSYTFVSGGSAAWSQSGTYTINGTWGQGGDTATTTTTFSYQAVGGGGGGSNAINVQVTASSPTIGGATPANQEYVAILTSFAGNGSLAAATFQTVHYHTPSGTLVTLCSSAGQASCTGTFTTIHKGFYTINFTAPSAPGGYFIHAWTNGPVATGSTGQGQGLGQFTITTIAGGSPDAAALAQIQTTLNGMSSSITVLTTGFGTISSGIQALTTSVNGLSGMQTSLNTISTGVTQLTTSLTAISGNINQINAIGGQITSMNNAINNNQTYVLVVAALAAITLVLELAILVRKLS
jgi:hypothetical protein